MKLRRVFAAFLASALLFQSAGPAHAAYTQIPDFLCDLGEKLYIQGRTDEALSEFRKALICNPHFERAKEYIRLIENERNIQSAGQTRSPNIPTSAEYADTAPTNVVRIVYPGSRAAPAAPAAHDYLPSEPLRQEYPRERGLPEPVPVPKSRVRSAPAVILLDENLKDLSSPVNIEKDAQILVRGRAIQRFLLTQEGIVKAEKINSDEILLTGTDYGYTYLHVWDSRGRWTMELLGIPPAPEGPTLEEEIRAAESRQRNFKFRYSIDWSQTETGRRLNSLNRQGYSWSHWMTLEGQTPYGYFDTQAAVREISSSRDLTYFTLGLTNGVYEDFEWFDLRLFDLTPGITNLAFSNTSVRGGYLHAKAFDKTIDYTVFAGKEGGGRYGGLSPGLNQTRDSYLSGVELNYLPQPDEEYSVSAFHGWGVDRDPTLNSYGFDAQAHKPFGDWTLGYETGYDTEHFSHLASAVYTVPKLNTRFEARETEKDFKTMTGTGWRAGEVGVLNTFTYTPWEQLMISNRLDVYRDRLYPNPEHTGRWNEDWNVEADYALDELTSLRSDYALQNQLGKVSPLRSQNAGIGLYHTFELFTRLNTYADFRHQETEYFTFHDNDFRDNKVLGGASVRVLQDLYYYANYEYNWLEAVHTGTRTNPQAFETGIDWNRRFFDTDFYTDLRVTYRKEKDTVSPVSFLSGENYMEYYGELAYRPTPDFEAFGSARFRNVTSENPSVLKRLDVFLYGGMRFTWDTGFRWDPTGSIGGFVFKDYNSDGIRQDSEPGIDGVKVWLGNKESQLTNRNGYYLFDTVKALKATVSLDSVSLPKGSVLTTPALYEVPIRQNRFSWVEFGVGSRTEISGIIFEDTDGNGQPGTKERGIKAVSVTLEDGSRSMTDDLGRYFFRKTRAGDHTIRIDLSTLPPEYLPTVSVIKEITLQEGSSYISHFPVKRIEQ